MSKILRIGLVLLTLGVGSVLAQTPVSTTVLWTLFNRAGAPEAASQCFTPTNVSLSGGFLILTALVQSASCVSIDLPYQAFPYTSAFVAMRTFNFLYGYIEFRAKFGPCNGGACGGSGSWPAVWMNDVSCQASDPTGTDNSCNEQEIDLAEFLSANFTTVNQQIHTPQFGGHNDGCGPSLTDASLNYHVYDVVWSAGSLVWSIDGTTTCTITASYVPNTAEYIKADIFIGGCCGGSINTAQFPLTVSLDYVKVGQGCTGINPLSGCTAMPFDDEFN
jgi:beta-glucanase (GH16 family)